MSGRPYRLSSLLALIVALALVGAGPAAGSSRTAASQGAGDYIVAFQPDVRTPVRLTRALEQARGFTATRTFGLLNGFAARLTPAQLAALRADPRVAYIDESRVFQGAGTTTLAAGEKVSRGIRRIHAVDAGYARGASGINVAVLDTGIDLNHADLHAVHGKNCINSNPAYDDRGHGTAVAGTIAARNNGSGGIGVAPGTRLVSVKVLDHNILGTSESLICGIEWVTSTLTDVDPHNDIRVANMSIYGRGDPVQDCAVTTDAVHRAICASAAAGVTYVVSAGNTGGPFDHPDRQSVLPAAYPEVLTVTAMSDSDGKQGGLGAPPTCKDGELDDYAATFSSWAYTEVGASHTIAAPGVCIRAITPGGYHKIGFGTTQTAPHVAGAVALCLNDGGTPGPCAGLTPAEVIQKMRADAAAWTAADPSFGFVGDPSRPTAGRYYGHLVRVGVERPAAVTHAPTGLTIKKGSRVSGGYGRLAADDGAFLEVRSNAKATRTTAWIARFASVPRDATSLALAYSGLNTRACSQTIALRRFSKGDWITLDTRVVGTSEVPIALAVAGSPTSFISGTGVTGEVQVRVRCATSAGTFHAVADMLVLEVSLP